jgi:hypothetical protein
MESLGDHAVVADEDGADQRVGTDTSATALRELQRSAQVRGFLFGADRGHAPLLSGEKTD